ncbi:hypothetical protein RIF29_08912 [Crotalaria pallida]|uniref:Pectinesterase inhibitor domain-containing protein n=1 Tax=Crotalaria pallida TaxID=3830 RepID=A0AAN9IJF7_CROPI
MKSSKVSCLLFTLSMMLIFQCSKPALGESLYESVCKETKNPSCFPLLKGDPRIPSAKDYLEISRFILEFGVKKGREGQAYLQGIAKKYPTELIKLCANNFYSSTILSFQSAILELKEDFLTANYDAKVAGDGPAYCAERLKEINIEEPLINQEVALISQAAFFATNHLE